MDQTTQTQPKSYPTRIEGPEGPLQDTSLVHGPPQSLVTGLSQGFCHGSSRLETVRLFVGDVAQMEHDLLSFQIPKKIVVHLHKPSRYISIQIWRWMSLLEKGKLCLNCEIRHGQLNAGIRQLVDEENETGHVRYDTTRPVPASTVRLARLSRTSGPNCGG
jgi:hypothetical protein